METQRGNNEPQSDDKQTQNSQREERIICIETENVRKEKQHDRDHMTDILTSSTGLMRVCLSVCVDVCRLIIRPWQHDLTWRELHV